MDTSVQRTGRQKTPAKAWLILAIVYVASFMAPVVQFKIPPLASWIIPEFGMDGITFGYLMSALSIIGVVLAFPAAFICRRFGLKPTVLISGACLAVGTAISAMTASLEVMMVARMIEGIGIGLIGVAAPTCVAIWFPDSTRGLALGIWATWFPIGITLMFNVSPSLAEAFGFRAVFWMCLAAIVVIFAVFALVYKDPEGADTSMGVEGTFAESFRHLKNKYIWLLGITFFVFNFIQLGSVNSFYNTFLETVRGFAPPFAASVTSILTILGMVFIPVVGAVSDRVPKDRRRFIIAGSYVLFVIGLLFAWDDGANANASMWAFIVVFGIAGGMGAGSSRPLAPLLMAPTSMGATMGMAVLQFFQNLGGAVGAPVFGMAHEVLGWGGANLAIHVPLCVAAIVLALFLKPSKAQKAVEAAEGRPAAAGSEQMAAVHE